MRIATDLYWPLPNDYWTKSLEEDPLDLPWLRAVESFAGKHEVTMYAVSSTGESSDFTLRGVRYVVRASSDDWDVEIFRPDIMLWNSFWAVRNFERVEKFRVAFLHGELSKFAEQSPGCIKFITEADMVLHRLPYEGDEVRRTGQKVAQWVPSGINVELVRSFRRPTRYFDVIGNMARQDKRPEFVSDVLSKLRERGFNCGCVTDIPKREYLGHLGDSKVYLHASCSDAWSRTISEAVVAGCVIVGASSSKGVAHQILENRGHLLDPNDPAAVADGIVGLLSKYESPGNGDLDAASHAQVEIDTISTVIDRAVWCLSRGRKVTF